MNKFSYCLYILLGICDNFEKSAVGTTNRNIVFVYTGRQTYQLVHYTHNIRIIYNFQSSKIIFNFNANLLDYSCETYHA